MTSKHDTKQTDPIEVLAREAGLDHTIAQTFPASDPLSSIPDPPEPELISDPSHLSQDDTEC
jgi:hypothetical protein